MQIESHFAVGRSIGSQFSIGTFSAHTIQMPLLESHLQVSTLQEILSVTLGIGGTALTSYSALSTTLILGGGSVPGTGGGGPSEALAKRTDQLSDSVFYLGEAVAGAVDYDAVWRIRRVTFDLDENSVTEWVNGAGDFTHKWTDRSTYEYH